MKISKYAILWLPSQPVIDYIQQWKDRVGEVEPDATYLNHPVHSTFFVFMADEYFEDKLIEILGTCCKSISGFKIEFDSWSIFNSDSVTGGDTIILAIKPNETLYKCQEMIASNLIQYIKQQLNYPNKWEGVYKESFERFGFPFVGKHWLPHISIASVSGKGRDLVAEISRSEITSKIEFIDSLSLFKIDEDNHKLLKTINF